MAKLHLKVTTPERTLLDEEVDEIVVKTKAGELAILPNHIPLVTEVIPGDMIVKNGEADKIALIYGGFLHVEKCSKAILLADSAEHIHEVNEKEAEEARKRAENLIQEVRDDKERFAEAEAELAKSLTRLKAIRKHKGYKNIKID